jgi:hypothetical protein
MANAAISAESKGMSRREFLYYIWGASLALYAAQFALLAMMRGRSAAPEGLAKP